MAERLKEKYEKEILPALVKELELENKMSAPGILKVSVNAGIGEFRESRESVEAFKDELAGLLGQIPQFSRAKKSVSGFKVKEGDIVGISATLRGEKMWAFIDKLVNIVLPRVRDFRGLSLEAFDENGNYSIGLSDHTIFPEVNPNKVKESRHLQINIVTSAENKQESELLLRKLGFPLKESK